MSYNKKAQGLSLSFVVVAALALLVLVIVSAIVVSNLTNTNKQQSSCEVKGGTCFYAEDYGGSCPPGQSNLPIGICLDGNKKDPDKVCCIPLGIEE